MNSSQEKKKRTVSRGSDTLGTGDVLGTVPAQPSSSSCQGLPSVTAAGTDGELATVAHRKEEDVNMEMLTRTASGAGLSRSSSLRSLRSNRSSCSMEVDRENRKRSRADMLEKGEARNEEDTEERDRKTQRKLAKRGRKKAESGDEATSSAQESSINANKEQARHILFSDYEDADCFIVTGAQRKEGNGEEVRAGMSKEETNMKKEEFGVVLKKKRGRKRKIHRKKIGIDELGVHEIEDSEDSEGYDALSAPEMAATAIEYLEEADEIRIKCKNIKGDLSGVMKRRLHNAKEIIKGLARTITKKVPSRKEGGEEEEDEACFLRMENKELKTRLKEKERHCQKKEKEIQLLRNELKEISEQMKFLREEVMKLKKNTGKVASPTGSSISKYERRVGRTLRAIEKDDTSVADDSDMMEIEHLPPVDWSTTEDNQGFKKPFPVGSSGPDTAMKPGPSDRSLYLQQKEERLVKLALEESLKEIRETRSRIKKYGSIDQTGKDEGKNKEGPIESPKPQRPPRVIQPRKPQGLRTDIRVLENVQLVGPRKEKDQIAGSRTGKDQESTTDQEWVRKKSKKEIREDKKKKKERQKPDLNSQSQQRGKIQKASRKPPRSAAVTIRIAEEDKERLTYASVLRKARDNISLEKIGIERTRIRKTAGGNILIEIPGINKTAEADKLAAELNKVLDKEIMVARPTIMGELRLFGLDDSITKEEVKEAISNKGNCKLTEIHVGEIGRMRSGAGMVWLKCPLTAAILLSKAEKICIGWSSVRIEMLSPREKQCFRCWRFGHLKYNCKSDIDRTGRCYKCGSSEHKIKECAEEAQCVICKESNKDWHHRMGSIACAKNRKTAEGTQKRSTPKVTLISNNTADGISEAMDVTENDNNDK